MWKEAYSDVQIENEHFRVTKWTLPPGARIAMHVHEVDYVVVPLTTETMHVVNADGSEMIAELQTGHSYTRPAGARHQVENRNPEAIVEFIEVEKLS